MRNQKRKSFFGEPSTKKKLYVWGGIFLLIGIAVIVIVVVTGQKSTEVAPSTDLSAYGLGASDLSDPSTASDVSNLSGDAAEQARREEALARARGRTTAANQAYEESLLPSCAEGETACPRSDAYGGERSMYTT